MDERNLVQQRLEEGMEIEKEGMKFYNDAVKKIKDPEGIRFLTHLSEEEGLHYKFIKELKDSVEGKKDHKVKGIISDFKGHKKIFPEKKEFEKEISTGDADKKILEEALKIEERSIKFYQGGLEKVSKDEYKKIFEVLIREEKSHKDWVEFLKDGLTIDGYWMDIEENFALDE